MEIKWEDLTPEQIIEFGLTPEVIKIYNDYFEKHLFCSRREKLFNQSLKLHGWDLFFTINYKKK